MKTTTMLKVFSSMIVLLLPMQVSYSAEEAYGWSIMSEQERIQYRETMRNLKTQEEQERYRTEHHNKMQERAKAKGVTLPDSPRDGMMDQMRDRSGTGAGSGMGGGMGGGKGR